MCMAAGPLHVVGGPFMDRGNCVVVRGRMGDDVLAWLRGDPIFRSHARALAGQFPAENEQESNMEVASHLRGDAPLAGLTVNKLNASATAFGHLHHRGFKQKRNGVVLRQLAETMQAKLSEIGKSELGANGLFLTNVSTEEWLWPYACVQMIRPDIEDEPEHHDGMGFSAALPHDLGPAPIGVPYVHRG